MCIAAGAQAAWSTAGCIAAGACIPGQLRAPVKLQTTSKFLDPSNFELIKEPSSIYGLVLAAHAACICDIEQQLEVRTGLRLLCSEQTLCGCGAP